ncbi:MAG: hypothetical protein R2715_24210, partial [Ilumatobacteraceae bacterium]
MSDTDVRGGAGAAPHDIEVTDLEVVHLDATGESERVAEPTRAERREARAAARRERKLLEQSVPRDPWGTRQWIEAGISIAVVLGLTLFTFAQLHPSLIFDNAVPTGGDMGAHVWAPA